MNNNTIIAIIVIALVVIGGYFLISSKASAPETDGTSMPANENNLGDDQSETVVTYTEDGFSPATITVKVGDTIRFANDSTSAMWVAADEHPTHTSYDGTSTKEHCVDGASTNGAFDMCHRGDPGATWTYTFTKAGSFDYHNHARASHGGTVVVE